MAESILRVDTKIGKILEENFKEDWFTEEMAQNILEQIGNSVSKEVQYMIKPGSASKLQGLVKELTNLFRTEQNMVQKTENDLDWYSSKKGWGDFIYQKREDVTYEKMFSICSEILDILRTGNLDEPLQLVVFSTSEDGSLSKVYYGDESKITSLKTVTSKDKEQLEYTLKESGMKVKDLQKENAFARHYNNFVRMINDYTKLETVKSKYEDKKINEGHIIEAFQRHLFFQHGIKRLSEEVFENFKEDRLTSKEIGINLYYALNNDPWFSGGDTGLMQDKGTNRKLASLMSIKMVASKLFELVQHYENFNIEDFKKLFTQGELDEMTRKDPEKVGNKTLKELVTLIGEKSK